MDRGYKRRRYVSDIRYQGKFVAAIAAICASGLLVALSLFNYLSRLKLQAATWKIHLGASAAGDIIRPYLLFSNILALALTVAALVAFSHLTLLKTAVPLYRLKRFIENIAEGNLNLNLDWMERDEFRETAGDLNDMAASMRERFAAVKRGAKKANKVSLVLKYIADKPELSSEKCAVLIERLDQLKEELDGFKISASK